MKFHRYSRYKESGVLWLGEIPVEWKVSPFKRQIDRNDGGVWGDEPDSTSGTLTTVLRSTEQTVDGRWKIDEPAMRKLSDSEIKAALLSEGDLVVTKSSGSSLHIGKTTLVTDEIAARRCCYSNFMQRIRLSAAFVPKYAWYVMNNDISRVQFDVLSNSTTGLANLNGSMIGELLIPVPPTVDQRAIASFLDRETAKIDTLIAKQEKLIGLLKEKRQAVISHAVAKGLDPTVPMKPSGVEWLGDVPEHWKVSTLKRFWSVKDCKHFTVTFLDEGFPIASIGEIRNNKFDLSKAKFASHEEFSFLREDRVPKKGDLIFCRNASVGTVAYVDTDQEFCLGQDVCLLSSDRPDNKYLFYNFLSSSLSNQLNALMVGATFKRINVENICNFIVTFPPYDEQMEIARFLDEATSKIDALITKVEQAITLQKEHRTALISAAVTGEIDVREATSELQEAA